MAQKRYVVMGAGEVGFHLARSLSNDGHDVTVIEVDPEGRVRIEESLDVLVIAGNGAQPAVLTAAGVASCDLFMAVSSSDEANLVAARIAKKLGASRAVVRVGEADEVIADRRLLEEVFSVDLLLSTQLLTTNRILNRVRGHNTMAVEYLAAGKVQLRKIRLDEESPLTQNPLRKVEMPAGSLVVAYFRGRELTVPSGDDKAEPGDDALILGTKDVIREAERMVASSREVVGTVVIAGGGRTGRTVAQALTSFDARVKIIERDRRCAEELATLFPRYEVIHGDATDFSLLQAERIELADTFVALTGHDEYNLMASLLARDLGVPQELALVHRAETSHLWRRLGLHHVFSPRSLAYARIREYIDSEYNANIVSLQRGAAVVIERRLASASPVAGVTLAEMDAPRGLIVGAVVRGEKVFVPRGKDRWEAGVRVLLLVKEEELDPVRLLFPGPAA